MFQDKNNLQMNRFTRYVPLIEDTAVPGNDGYFFMTDIDLESSKVLNKVKELVIYYKKNSEQWDLHLNFVKYNKNSGNEIKWWTHILTWSGCSLSSHPNYECMYTISDFSSDFQNNIFSYLFFFSSQNWISYALEWRDIHSQIVELPSRYLEQKFELKTNTSQISKKIDSKIDLYQKFNVNINLGLYNIK